MLLRIILVLCAVLAFSQAGLVEAQRPAGPAAGPSAPPPRPVANPPSPAQAAQAAAAKLAKVQALLAQHPGWRLAGPNDPPPPADAMPAGTPARGPGPSTLPPGQRRGETGTLHLLGLLDSPEDYHLTNCNPGLYWAQLGYTTYGVQGWQWCFNSLGSQIYEAMILVDDMWLCDALGYCFVYTYEQQGCTANWRQNYEYWTCQPYGYYNFPLVNGMWSRGRVDHHGDNGVEHYYGYSLTPWLRGGSMTADPEQPPPQ